MNWWNDGNGNCFESVDFHLAWKYVGNIEYNFLEKLANKWKKCVKYV